MRFESGFENPPNTARPRVWWHWMNGNITKEGIKLDLEWMHRVGLGGFQNFDAALSTPQVVEKRLAYMTPEWKDAFKYATVLADQLGLEEAIAGSPGWSESGGPWVPASQGMKKYVWSETSCRRRQAVHRHARSSAVEHRGLSESGYSRPYAKAPEGSKPIPQFYADSAVIAYRRPASDVPLESLHPKVTASGGVLMSRCSATATWKKPPSFRFPRLGESAWIQYEFAEPQTIRAVILVTEKSG